MLPTDEAPGARLLNLVKAMSAALPHPGCLNPRAHRLFDTHRGPHRARARNVVDGSLLAAWGGLDRRAQAQIAAVTGVSVDAVYELVHGVYAAAAVF